MLSLFSRRIRTTTTSSILLSSSSFHSASTSSVRFCSSGSSSSSSGAASVAQQSEQEEYEEILRNAKKQNQLQQQQDQPAMDSSATARLLRVAAPALFDELKFVSEFNKSSNTNNDTKTISSSSSSSSKNKPDGSKNPLEGQVLLAKKYLQVDSPEVFTWVCSSCDEEFQAPVLERALNDVDCPTCSKKNAPKTLSDFRDLMVEISPMANDPFLDPESVPADSRKKVEWKCRVCGYNWVARVSDRCAVSSFVASGSIRTTYASASGGACPRCHIRQSVGAAEKLKNEWHPVKNGDLDPAATLVLSEKKKSVWWLCLHCTHEWNAKVSSRFAGQGCPACGSGSTAAKAGRPKGSGNKKDMLIGGGGFSSSSSNNNNPFVEDDRKKEHHREQVRLRKILLQQQENADRENQYKMHLKHLEEHGKLKEMFSSTAAAATTPATRTTGTQHENDNNNDDDEQISLGGAETKSVTKKSVQSTTTTTTAKKAPAAGGVMITKAKKNPLRAATVVQLHMAEKKKEMEYKRQKELELMRKIEAKNRDEAEEEAKSPKVKKVLRATSNLKKQFSQAKYSVELQKKKRMKNSKTKDKR